jgi:hypothetical protein
LSGAIAKPASINLQKLVLSPTGLINLGFILREDLLLCSSYLPLGVPNWVPNKYYHTPPVLVAPKEKEPVLLYIAATHQVVSTVLIVELSEEGKVHGVQRPVYFLSELLSPLKQRYPHYQKLTILIKII